MLYNEDKTSETDELDEMIEAYLRAAKSSEMSALKFWKKYQSVFPSLSSLARKYLSVPASSAGVERMFSIAGHIFSLKRRKLGVVFFSDLVFLKLNENFFN